MHVRLLLLMALAFTPVLAGAEPPAATPAPPKLKITPGKIVFPTGEGEMRRPWGELVSLDLATRTGTFRNESDDKVMPFTVLPYAELLHHATLGDLQDFKIGERAIFRLHQNDAGEWVWLSYIQDEMNMMNGHKEFFHVESIDPQTRRLTVTQASADLSYVREKGIVLETDAQTRYWKKGQPAQFADLQVGDRLREKSHGLGAGKHRVAWEIFLDQESLDRFQAEQKGVHLNRMETEGAPGYVDSYEGTRLSLTMFPEGSEIVKTLKAGAEVQVAPAGLDRQAMATAASATVAEAKMDGRYLALTLELSAGAPPFTRGGLARLWKK